MSLAIDVRVSAAELLGRHGGKDSILPMLEAITPRSMLVSAACMRSLNNLALKMPLAFPEMSKVKSYSSKLSNTYLSSEFDAFVSGLQRSRMRLKTGAFLKGSYNPVGSK